MRYDTETVYLWLAAVLSVAVIIWFVMWLLDLGKELP